GPAGRLARANIGAGPDGRGRALRIGGEDGRADAGAGRALQRDADAVGTIRAGEEGLHRRAERRDGDRLGAVGREERDAGGVAVEAVEGGAVEMARLGLEGEPVLVVRAVDGAEDRRLA